MFVLTLSLILLLLLATGTLGAVLLRMRDERREVTRRTDLATKGMHPERGSRMTAGVVAHLTEVAEWFRRIFTFGLPYRWGMRAGPLTLVLIAIAGAGLCWLMLHALFHMPLWVVLPSTLVAAVLLPRQLLKMQQDAAEQRFLDLFPDSIDMVVRMVRAGLPIMAAIRTIGNEAPPPIDAVFSSLADQVDIGILFTDALVQTGERIGLADFRFFAVAVSLQHATGGNIASTLEILSEIIRKRRTARLRAKATTGEVRVSAYVLGSLPFVVIGGLLLTSPAYLAPLISDPRGNVIVGAAIVSLSLGFLTMRQLMRSATKM